LHLITSPAVLGHFSGLTVPPASVTAYLQDAVVAPGESIFSSFDPDASFVLVAQHEANDIEAEWRRTMATPDMQTAMEACESDALLARWDLGDRALLISADIGGSDFAEGALDGAIGNVANSVVTRRGSMSHFHLDKLEASTGVADLLAALRSLGR
jgi:hypothetical protein